MTGYTEENHGGDEVGESVLLLSKPFTPDGLLQAVRNGLDGGRGAPG